MFPDFMLSKVNNYWLELISTIQVIYTFYVTPD